MKKYWFKSKSFGWGWTPCSREGWLVTIGFGVAMILLSFLFQDSLERGEAFDYLALVFGLSAILIIIAFKTGEKPKWNWRKQN